MADIRIKDLANFSGTPTATDFLAIDSPDETKKLPGNVYALNSKIDYAINEIKSTPNGTAKIIVSDIPTASIGDVSLGNEEYFKSALKKICEIYPNRSETLFIGKGQPGNFWFYEIFIYNTSIVNSEGLPRYSFGRVFSFGTEYYVSTNNYVWKWEGVGVTNYAEFQGEYISGNWNVRKNGSVAAMQVGNLTNFPTGEFRMNGVVPVGFRPAATASYTLISREATPRVFALSITPTGDLIFYNYSSAYPGVLPIATIFTYLT